MILQNEQKLRVVELSIRAIAGILVPAFIFGFGNSITNLQETRNNDEASAAATQAVLDRMRLLIDRLTSESESVRAAGVALATSLAAAGQLTGQEALTLASLVDVEPDANANELAASAAAGDAALGAARSDSSGSIDLSAVAQRVAEAQPEGARAETLTALLTSDEERERAAGGDVSVGLATTGQLNQTGIDAILQIVEGQTEADEAARLVAANAAIDAAEADSSINLSDAVRRVRDSVPAPDTRGITVVVRGRPGDSIYLVEDPPRLVQQVISRASGGRLGTYENIDVVLPQVEGMIENDLSDHQETVDEDIAVSDELLYLLIFRRGDSSYANFQEFPRDETIALP